MQLCIFSPDTLLVLANQHWQMWWWAGTWKRWMGWQSLGLLDSRGDWMFPFGWQTDIHCIIYCYYYYCDCKLGNIRMQPEKWILVNNRFNIKRILEDPEIWASSITQAHPWTDLTWIEWSLRFHHLPLVLCPWKNSRSQNAMQAALRILCSVVPWHRSTLKRLWSIRGRSWWNGAYAKPQSIIEDLFLAKRVECHWFVWRWWIENGESFRVDETTRRLDNDLANEN